MQVNRELAEKVLKVVDAGLVCGIGEPIPGKMCVEAAVCYALGLPHSDKPPCVGSAVRELKIRLNDSKWSSDAARTKGMRELAIAQLGSTEIDQVEFAKYIAEQTIRQIVPIALRAAARLHQEQKHKDALEEAARRCEKEGSDAASYAASCAANGAASAARAASDAARAASDAARAASYAAIAASYAASYAASCAANDAARAASYAASYAASCAANDAASYAASCAANDAASADRAASDAVLTLFAKITVEALKKFGALGVQWLDLCQ